MNNALSICIPSANRAKYLKETLEAFLPQVEPLGIPIYISYNDKGDTYREMLEKFKQKRYPYVFFKTDPDTQGFDKNLDVAVRMASSKYIWIFGDDDLPRPNAIETIFSHLDKGYPLIIVNAATFSYDLSTQVEKGRLLMDEDRTYPPEKLDELIRDTASYITFLGALVFQRERWTAIDINPFIGTDYSHVAVCYRLAEGRKVLVVAASLLDIRLGVTTWSHRYFEVELTHWPAVVWGLPSRFCSEETKRSICDETPVKSLRRMLATRAYGHYNAALYRCYLAGSPALSPWKKMLLRAITLIPESWLRRLYAGYLQFWRLYYPGWRTLALFRLSADTREFRYWTGRGERPSPA